MARQITTGYDAPSTAALEERIRHLEVQVAALTEMVGVLVARLEGAPAEETGDTAAAQAARLVHELVISTRLSSRSDVPVAR